MDTTLPSREVLGDCASLRVAENAPAFRPESCVVTLVVPPVVMVWPSPRVGAANPAVAPAGSKSMVSLIPPPSTHNRVLAFEVGHHRPNIGHSDPIGERVVCSTL